MAPKANGRGVQVEDTRICVVMVGLPARGKSYIAQKGNYQLRLLLLLDPLSHAAFPLFLHSMLLVLSSLVSLSLPVSPLTRLFSGLM